jgi:hypothetical protein
MLWLLLLCRDPDAHTYSMQIVFKAPKEQLQPPVLLPPPPPVLPGPPPLGSMQHMPPGETIYSLPPPPPLIRRHPL